MTKQTFYGREIYVTHTFKVICAKRGRVLRSIRGSKHRETDENTGTRRLWMWITLPYICANAMTLCLEKNWCGRLAFIDFVVTMATNFSTRLPLMWPAFDSRCSDAVCEVMWGGFVVCSCPCSEGFSPGTPVFLPPQKPTFPNANSTWKLWLKDPLCGSHWNSHFVFKFYLFYQ